MDKRIESIIEALNKLFPNPKPALNFTTPFESLVATILSAQCTDVRVNIVTKTLFKVANTPKEIVELGEKKLEEYIRSTGFFRAKAKNIVAAAKKLLADYGGKIPQSLEEMQRLPGVGRKTAGVVLAQAFKIPAFPVDRHIFRVAHRLALSTAKTPDKTDEKLRQNIPEKFWIRMHLQLVFLGRQICRPKPKCEICPLLKFCPEGQRTTKKRVN